jgi:hypothetical protein
MKEPPDLTYEAMSALQPEMMDELKKSWSDVDRLWLADCLNKAYGDIVVRICSVVAALRARLSIYL